MERSTLQLLDVNIDSLSIKQALDRARAFLDSQEFHHIVTPGPEFLLEATANDEFRTILNQADLSLADGMGLHVGARLTGQNLQQRIPGVDFVERLLALAETGGYSVFFFGAPHGVGEAAAKQMIRRHPKLKIVGIESRYGNVWGRLHERRLIERIHLAKPDILLVALGAPKQELWIEHHRHDLHDVRIAIGVGRTLDYLAGVIRRPRAVWRKLGLEWLYTYIFAGRFHQPQHRRQRVTNATWHFLWTILRRHHAKHS